MRFYLASRFVRQAELRDIAAQLRAAGHSAPCRWLGENHDLPEPAPILEGRRLAQEDWEDIAAAEAMIVFTGSPTAGRRRGGYHVEFGIALASRKPVAIVGPRENVFHYLPQVAQFDTWADCYETVAYPSPVHAEWYELRP